MKNTGIKLGLDRIRELMHLLGDPQDKLKFIHVAGTNGKGSTCSFISAMLAACGYRVGMYTSPAVEDVREQYTINGEWISSEDYALCLAEIYAAMIGRTAEEAFDEPTFRLSEPAALKDMGRSEDQIQGEEQIQGKDRIHKGEQLADGNDDIPTAFELETALAFLYFYKNNCDYVVLETGLGGAGDATNIVKTTVLAVFTSISEDHLGMIGNNIEEIARTKAGIIKPGVPAVMIENDPVVREIIKTRCRDNGSEFCEVLRKDIVSEIRNSDQGPYLELDFKERRGVRIDTAASYQADNAALALAALDMLGKYDKELAADEDKAVEALQNVRIPYRMERICEAPLFYLDGAHNPDAARRLSETIEGSLQGYKLIFIMGMFKDKDYREVVRTMAPLAEHIFTVQTPDSPRALEAEKLRRCILEETLSLNEDQVETLSIEEAVKRSISVAAGYEEQGSNTCIIAFGSLSYLIYIKNQLIRGGS